MAEGERVSIAQMRRYARMNIIVGFLIWGIALAGISMMMPIMYNSIASDMGWTVTQTTSFMAIKSAVSALGGLFAGGLFVKYGLKRIFVASVITIGISTCLLYVVDTLPVYYALASISGFASILSLVAIQVTLARWYSASLGRITGIAMLGGAVAGAVVPMATSYGLQHFGWHATAAFGGVIILIFLTLVSIFMLHETPEAYGYTAEELDPGRNPAKAATSHATDPGPEFSSIVRTKQFILLILATALSGVISNGINEYVPLFIERNTDLGTYVAALGLTIVLVISGVGKILFGWVFDRFSTKGVAFCWAICGIAVLLTFPVAGFISFLIFTVVRGVSHGGVMVQAPILARHIYGVRPLAQIISLLNASFHLGASVGIAAIGIGVDMTGGFTIPFVAIAVVSLLTALIGLSFVPKYWVGYKQKASEQSA